MYLSFPLFIQPRNGRCQTEPHRHGYEAIRGIAPKAWGFLYRSNSRWRTTRVRESLYRLEAKKDGVPVGSFLPGLTQPLGLLIRGSG